MDPAQKATNHSVNFQTLPKYIRQYIFSYLSPDLLCKIARVSKVWYEDASSDQVWKAVTYNFFPGQQLGTFSSWKSLFRQMLILHNFKLQHYKNITLKKEDITAAKIIKNKLFFHSRNNLIIKNSNTLQSITKIPCKHQIFDILQENDMFYALSREHLFKFDQKNIQVLLTSKNAEIFDSFLISGDFIYLKGSYMGANSNGFASLCKKNESGNFLEQVQIEFPEGTYCEKIAIHNDHIFVASGTQMLILKKDLKTVVKTLSHFDIIYYFTAGSDRLYCATKNLIHRSWDIHIWDLTSYKAIQVIHIRQPGIFAGLQLSENVLFYGVSHTNGLHTITAIDTNDFHQIFELPCLDDLVSFQYDNGLLLTLSETLYSPSEPINNTEILMDSIVCLKNFNGLPALKSKKRKFSQL